MTTKLTERQYKDRPCAAPDCDRILRSKGLTEEEAPGTYRAASYGMCARCYGRTRDRRPAVGSDADLMARFHKSNLDAWIKTYRTDKGIPAEGIGFEVAA